MSLMKLTALGQKLAICLIALVGLATGTAQAQYEIWVVNEGTKDISIVDPVLNTVVSTITLQDLDFDGTVEVPTDICFSTLPNQAGTKAFVNRERFIEVFDVATRSPDSLAGPFDIGGASGQVRGCSAAFPREYASPGGPPVRKSLLFVGVNQATGSNFVVLDQAEMLAGAASPQVASGPLTTEAVDQVSAMGLPEGNQRQRVWFGVSSATSSGVIKLATTDPFGLSWSVVEQRIDSVAPGSTAVATPACRELTIDGKIAQAQLNNSELGLSCAIPGSPTDVTVTGPAPNVSTVFATDATNDQLHIVNPTDCTDITSIDVGTDPRAVTTIGWLQWDSVWTANRGSDTLSRVDVDGDRTATTIFLNPVEAGGGGCFKCPIAIGTAYRSACDYKDLMLEKVDSDLDGTDDDIRISFSASSPQCEAVPAAVACGCITNVECPCICDQFGVNCVRPGLQDTLLTDGGDQILSPEWPIDDDLDWIDLGSFIGPFTHEGVGNPDQGSQAYFISAPD